MKSFEGGQNATKTRWEHGGGMLSCSKFWKFWTQYRGYLGNIRGAPCRLEIVKNGGCKFCVVGECFAGQMWGNVVFFTFVIFQKAQKMLKKSVNHHNIKKHTLEAIIIIHLEITLDYFVFKMWLKQGLEMTPSSKTAFLSFRPHLCPHSVLL